MQAAMKKVNSIPVRLNKKVCKGSSWINYYKLYVNMNNIT